MSAGPFARGRGEFRGVFIFALLAAFALLSLVVVIAGARSYRMINATAEKAYISRTGLSYLTGKVRSADEAGMVGVRNENGVDVLTLGGVYGEERYNTYIYCDGSNVCEYFAKVDLPFSPDLGEAVFAAAQLSCLEDGGLLTITLADGAGQTYSAAVFLQSAKGGGA